MGERVEVQVPPERTGLVVIDVQERLVPHMADFWPALRNMRRLIRAFQAFARPVVVTEQYPRGLGPTIPSIARLVPGPYHPKTAFGCYGCEAFRQAAAELPNLVLCGMETHVCVLQTALAGVAAGQRIIVAADAVTSRHADNRRLGFAQMAAAGVELTSTETVLFQMLGVAGGDVFKQISRLVK